MGCQRGNPLQKISSLEPPTLTQHVSSPTHAAPTQQRGRSQPQQSKVPPPHWQSPKKSNTVVRVSPRQLHQP
ncbi:hypothetical protein CCACVL1_21963 [Corchorus capsularis]|uniref:Uncharacterized protein n=1 Tax=Corchorus capsularis TaxID=210143 RepID=A0A1R3H1S2_COCAP|nr:hypothetical protein CCACVL1_21963 [Corchorus capsularis]